MGESIVTTVVTSMTSFASGCAGIIVDVFDSIFVGAEGALTNFGTYSLVFLGVGIVTGVIGSVVAKVG